MLWNRIIGRNREDFVLPWAYLLLALNWADVAISVAMIQGGGMEVNPLAVALMGRLGLWALAAIKVAITFYVCVLVWLCPLRILMPVLKTSTAFYLFALWWNISQILIW